MRCEKIREYLADDRRDGQVMEHLKTCAPCRQAAQELAAQRALFRSVKEQPVPERVWQKISDALVREGPAQERADRSFWERLLETVRPRRPVFATAGICAMLLIAFIVTGVYFHQKNAAGGEIPLGVQTTDFLYDLGTSVEEYFL